MSAKTFTVRAIIALTSVFDLAVYKCTGNETVMWIGLIFYFTCLVMFAWSLLVSLIRERKVTADLLVVTVMAVSLTAGQPLSGAIVAWFISMGLALSFAIIEKTRRRIEALVSETKRSVRVIRDERIIELPVESVMAGDLAVVAMGEEIPIDGEIVEGESPVDESVVTGEPFPVFKRTGDSVVSGSVVVGQQLKIKADRAGDKGFLHVIASEIDKAMKKRPEIHRRADTIVQYFISGVVLYATGVFFFTGGISGDFSTGLVRMAAITAIACPCAWALSVPTAFAASIGGLSSMGILSRGGAPLERAGAAVNVALDKTGTITTAHPEIAGIKAFEMTEEELLGIAASLEAGFSHPIAEAIVSYASIKGIRLMKTQGAEYLPGLGVKASVNGQKVVMGSTDTLKAMDMTTPSVPDTEGRPVWISVDNRIAGAIIIRDELRESAGTLGRDLRSLGIKRIEIATGDNDTAEVARVAQLIDADDFHWGLRPKDKTGIIQRMRRDGPVIMVGDGINDAISLASADVGITLGHEKADLAVKSSDIVIMNNDAEGILTVIRTGRRLIRVIRQNYAWAIAFNTAGIALATAGLLSPWLAALFHHVSSVLVVINSARLVKIKDEKRYAHHR